jgi:hypothetical protein
MGVSVRGHSHPHLHSPCRPCGYATRYKQWPERCACPDAEWQEIPAPHVAEIWAEPEALDAARKWAQGPGLAVAPRYAAGRPELTRHT